MSCRANDSSEPAPAQLSSAPAPAPAQPNAISLFVACDHRWSNHRIRRAVQREPTQCAVAKLGVAPFRESINPKRLEDQGPGGREKKRSAEEEGGGGGGGTGIRTRTPAQIRSGWAERSGGAFQRAGSGILPSSSASELTLSARAHALEQHGLLGSAKTSQTRQLSSIFDFDVTSAARARRANLLCLFQKKKPRCGPGKADPARNREQASVSPNSLEAATRIAFRSHPPHDTVKPELLLFLPLCTDSLRAPSQNSESKTFTLPTAIANGAEQTFREACDSTVLQYRGLAFRRYSAWKALLRVESPSNTGARTKKKRKIRKKSGPKRCR
ncbi:hypothetical protein L1887_56881 [Cichorium endivia]|nr:hypothetical protein L1887_56881 [Cichorium endivia]